MIPSKLELARLRRRNALLKVAIRANLMALCARAPVSDADATGKTPVAKIKAKGVAA